MENWPPQSELVWQIIQDTHTTEITVEEIARNYGVSTDYVLAILALIS